MSKKLTTEEFIEKAIAVHGDRYDYSKAHYKNANTKVKIFCREHGYFEQIPGNHISSSQGCKSCGYDKNSKSKTSSTDAFIAKAKIIHGDKYDYSNTEYIRNDLAVVISCQKHGIFNQSPNSHLTGKGCPACSGKQRLDTSKFITRARSVHGDKYDYSLTEYISGKEKVKIICAKHGVFSQLASNHINSKQGCPSCAGYTNTKTAEFISQAMQLHGGKYDYSQTIYVNSKTKVKIICKSHGAYFQRPENHIKRLQGCPACAGNKRLDTKSFINRAIMVHGDKYDYQKVIYKLSTTKVLITCKIHGDFEQVANSHLLGFGCAHCSGNAKIDFNEFLRRAKNIHGDKYSYDYVEYSGDQKKVKIICPAHGPFMQSPGAHIRAGQGCPVCGGKLKLTGSQFISRAIKVHGDKYDYSNVNYVRKQTKVEIICPEHGPFMQTPHDHAQGVGCPNCGLASDNDAIYIWKAVGQYFNGEQVYKLGITSARLAQDRIHLVAKKARFDFEIVCLKQFTGNVVTLESQLLKLGCNPLYSGHSGATEFRALTKQELAKALELIEIYQIEK